MGKWMRKKTKMQKKRRIIVTQIVQTAAVCTSTAKSHLCCLELLPLVHSAGGGSTCSKVYNGGRSKGANRRKREGLCEVGAKQVGSSSAADWGLRLQEICWSLSLPPSQPASQPGVLPGDKWGVYPGRLEHLNNEPEQRKEKVQPG